MEEPTGVLLWRVNNQWQRRIRAALAPLHVTQVQLTLLIGLQDLAQQGLAVTQARLASHCALDTMMTSQVVRSLERAGLLQRSRSAGDRRARHLLLTPTGQDKLAAAQAVLRRADAGFFDPLGNAEGLLRRALTMLDGDRSAG